MQEAFLRKNGTQSWMPFECLKQDREYQLSQIWLDKKHDAKGNSANQKNIPCFSAGTDRGNKQDEDPCQDPSEDCSQCVCHQIIDIRGTEREQLQTFDQQGSAQAEQKSMVQFSEASPKKRQDKPQGNEQDNVQKAVFKIREHIGKGGHVDIGIIANVVNGGQPHNCIHAGQITGKDEVADRLCAAVKIPSV